LYFYSGVDHEQVHITQFQKTAQENVQPLNVVAECDFKLPANTGSAAEDGEVNCRQDIQLDKLSLQTESAG